jgi:SAM-dependent methyltransferase
MVDQVAFWNGPAAERWVRDEANLDAMLQPFGQAALEAAAVVRDEAVLDVGCGCGDTSLALARRVGSGGRVLGLDASAPMLARARDRAATLANVTFLQGDASREPLAREAFDLLFSRFGVMFFANPVVAFAHLRLALRPQGRVVFVCWQPLAENRWATAPFEAATSVLGRPDPQPPEAPGPFSFGDAGRVRRVLEGAGLREASLRRFDAPMRFGTSDSLEDAAQEIARVGPTARLLVDRDPATVSKALAAIRAILPPFASPKGGVEFPAAAWIVTARY